jgi:hypothetical protein
MAHRLSGLAPPPADGDPRATMHWVRRMEIVSAVGCFVAAVAFGDPAWLRWVLVALGLVSLSPWPGAAAILHKADNDPGVLISDPERRRERGRRALWITSLLEVALLFVVGLVVGGLSVAIVLGASGVVCSLGGAWLYRRWLRSGAP